MYSSFIAKIPIQPAFSCGSMFEVSLKLQNVWFSKAKCKQNPDFQVLWSFLLEACIGSLYQLWLLDPMAHRISWFAVSAASYKFFAGKGLAFNLMPYPSHAVLRWFGDSTTLKVAHDLIDNSELKCFQKKKKVISQINLPNCSIFFVMSSQFNHWNWIILKISILRS